MTQSSPISARLTKSRLGRVLSLLAVAGVGVALVYGGTTSALAQKSKADEKKTDDKKTVKKSAKLDGKILLQAKADYQTLANTIDQQIETAMKAEELTPSGTCTDEEFIRRVTLDLTGVIPTADEVQKFLANKDSNRRAKLVDDLLQNHRYGKFFGEMWAKELLNKESVNKRLIEGGLYKWMEERFNGNMHWDKMVYEIITASGPQDQNGATTFFISNAAPEKMTDKVTEHFIGVRLECAQCHNHPFTEYKQTEYWGMAAFFMNVSLSANPKNAAKNNNIIEVTEKAAGGKGKKIKLPMEAKIVPPQFLKAEQPTLAKGEPYRPVLAKWLTAKTNPYFARAAVNKVWWHLLGRGLVNPHNDMHPDNPSSHPDLLATLADQYKQNDFDQKYLIRAICATKTYQRSSKPNATNGDDHEMFSHGLVRSMHPEQIYDSLTQVIGELGKIDAGPKKGAKGGPVTGRQKFIDFFTGDDGYKPLEYQAGIPQALMLMNAKQFNATTKAIAQATKTAKTPEAVIDFLYLSTVSRHATATETQKLATYVQKTANPQNAYGDILWALLNSSEFALNH